ncbi:MAG: metallophosphoesterase [candidate division Zixibacteria bacterium]|nr:metallophosphoesterase [candidate division Zixibacteria bacterium]
MKIIHTSDIRLGAHFVGLKLAGDKLRAGIKSTFSKIIDYTVNEKADLLIIAGNLFDSYDVSRNLQDYIAGELSRLNDIPIVILPGAKNNLADNSFWKSWNSLNLLKNVHTITDTKKPYINISHLDCTVYGFPKNSAKDANALSQPIIKQNTKYHIGVMCCPPDEVKAVISKTGLDFDYVALGSNYSFSDFTQFDINAAYSGSPEQLDFNQEDAGNIACVEIGSQNKAIVKKVNVGVYKWQTMEIDAKEISSNDDLINKLKPLANTDTLLKVKLTGLALFESSLIPVYVQQLIENEFLYLDIIDDMKVLPENISEVKVSEKTILGQYIKYMAQEINKGDESRKNQLEKSLKVGYMLLQGREPW